MKVEDFGDIIIELVVFASKNYVVLDKTTDPTVDYLEIVALSDEIIIYLVPCWSLLFLFFHGNQGCQPKPVRR